MPTLSFGFIPSSSRNLHMLLAFAILSRKESSLSSSLMKGKSPCNNSIAPKRSLIVLGAFSNTLKSIPLISRLVSSSNGFNFLSSANASDIFCFVEIFGSDI